MQDYVFVIRHKKGRDNAVADALSRRTHDNANVQRMMPLTAVETRVTGFEEVPEGYADCPDFGKIDVSFLCVVKTQRRWSNKIYKIKLTNTRYNNQVLGKYQVDPQRAGLTLIVKLTWSNLGLKGVLKK